MTPLPNATVDLTDCDREPIHMPGAIQPHGVLLVLREPELEVVQASENAEGFFGAPAEALLGRRLDTLLPPDALERLQAWVAVSELARPAQVSPSLMLSPPAGCCDAIVHRIAGGLVLELEPHVEGLGDAAMFLQATFERLEAADTIQGLCEAAAREVRRLTGFDRVKVYRFDPDWHGETIAEDRAEHMDSYLGLHFPASDIPQQARRLYTLNRTRIIPDVGYVPARVVPAVNPATGAVLDMSFSVLRSVSPVHVEYLRNMEVQASMSISIVRDGELWGLIACHHARPLRVPYHVRTACELLGQLLALLLTSKQDGEGRRRQAQRRELQARLLETMVRADDFVTGLAEEAEALLALVDAQGAAVVSQDRCVRLGEAPPEETVRALTSWLDARKPELEFHTDRLARSFPGAEAFQQTASGLLAITLSRLQRYYVLWFRPEVPQTVLWAGNPNKAVSETRDGGAPRLHPRQSFQAWQDTLRGRALPWSTAEVEAARELQRAISDVVFVKMEKLARLNASLEASNTALEQANHWLHQRNRELQDFAYVASHDLQEPLRKIRAFGDLLQTEHARELDEAGLHYVERMGHAAARMSDLIADLLGYSRVVTHAEPFEEVKLRNTLDWVLHEMGPALDVPDVRVEIGELPAVEADPEQMRRLFHNLLGNALKFRRAGVPLHVRVASAPAPANEAGDAYHIYVTDNGQGFDEKYLDRIFLPFQRLQARGAHEGTGIGLAISKRIVERHGGAITATSTPGEGSTFVVTLPVHPPRVSQLIDPGA